MNGRKKANQRWARVDARRLDVAPGGLGLAADPAQVQALAELFEQVSKRQLRRHQACSLTGSAVSRRSRSSASLASRSIVRCSCWPSSWAISAKIGRAHV